MKGFLFFAVHTFHVTVVARVHSLIEADQDSRMRQHDMILRNACVNGAFTCDIGIKDELIVSLGSNLTESEETTVIDCEGAVVTPGGIDGHVHLAQDRSPRARAARYKSADTGELIRQRDPGMALKAYSRDWHTERCRWRDDDGDAFR